MVLGGRAYNDGDLGSGCSQFQSGDPGAENALGLATLMALLNYDLSLCSSDTSKMVNGIPRSRDFHECDILAFDV